MERLKAIGFCETLLRVSRADPVNKHVIAAPISPAGENAS
ncbi:hypothetical protein PAMC26510_05930 [Caballeronia sordidicola]|uniref:Uncharacterized protein n=1 Tax=Caballeronia sordidicola TaxID=196367 RepID=A0A242N6K6_CABSO|nr:hypothetical protein PAMC26510_05930 [Caballeronia sordidicola]